MRRVVRPKLGDKTLGYLKKRQDKVDSEFENPSFSAEASWKQARNTAGIRDCFKNLKVMMGDSERCVYCHDSHGSDIEHFRPKSVFPHQIFVWDNFLLCCTECGRFKGDKFPTDDGGALLIDPTIEEPWTHLDFDPVVGALVPRFSVEGPTTSAKGEATVQVLQLDRREASRKYIFELGVGFAV